MRGEFIVGCLAGFMCLGVCLVYLGFRKETGLYGIKSGGVVKRICSGELRGYYDKIAGYILNVFSTGNVDMVIDRAALAEVLVFFIMGAVSRSVIPGLIFFIGINLVLVWALGKANAKKNRKMVEGFPEFIVGMVNQLQANPNVKNALNKVYLDLGGGAGSFLKKLVVWVNTTNDVEVGLERFAKEVDNIYMRSAMIVLSEYSKHGGDVVQNLNDILELVDIEIEGQRKGMGAMSQAMIDSIMLTAASVAAFIGNMRINPVMGEVFFTTQSGRVLFMVTATLFIISVVMCAMLIYERR